MSSKNQLPHPSQRFFIPTLGTVVRAWNLFVFSAAFAILFNAFYTDGIELRYSPSKPKFLNDILKDKTPATPASYAGWNTAPSSAVKPAASTHAGSSSILHLSLSGVKKRFDQKTAVFLDARNPDLYAQGHIPGSLNFPANDADKYAPQVMPQLPDKTREIIVYCSGGDCTLSMEIAQLLVDQGYKRVEVFEDGWPGWNKAGYAAATGMNP